MADTTALKNRIRAAVKANDNQEITGPVLQQSLLDIVDELNGAIETEVSQHSDDSTLQQGINTERQARIDADNALGRRIAEEEQARQSGDSTLNQIIFDSTDQTTNKANYGTIEDLDQALTPGIFLWKQKGKQAGIVQCFLDNMNHALTQILCTNFQLTDTENNVLNFTEIVDKDSAKKGTFSSHQHTIHTYIRTYGYTDKFADNQSSAQKLEKGWSGWVGLLLDSEWYSNLKLICQSWFRDWTQETADDSISGGGKFATGHIKTKNFDSSKINPITPTSSDLFLNVKDYGAVGNGTTDDTEALENAMADAFAKSKSLYFPSGTYKIRRSLTLRSNMEIFGHKSAVIKKKAASTTTLTQAASAGATTIYVASVDGFEVGDQFCISSEASTYPAARHCSLGIVTKINTTNNSITFVSCYDSIKHGTIKNHVVGCYVTNSFAIFRSWGMFYDANNVEIHDLTLDGNRQNGEFGDWMNGCVHIDATTGAADGITYKYPASNLTLRDLVIKNSPFDGVSDQGDGGLTMENCRIDNPYMHGVHFGTNYSGAKCVANEITGTANGAAFFWCQNVQNIEISTNIIKNCYKGCSDYEYSTPAQNSIITNNIFINITNYVFDFSHTGSTFKDKLIICNNMIEDVNYIIANLANKTKVSFCENIITNFVAVPTYLFATGGANNLYFIGNIAIGANEIFSNSSITKLVEVGNSWN